MPVQRIVPSPRARRSSKAIAALIAVTVIAAAGAGYVVGTRAASTYEILQGVPASAQRVAFVRETPCGSTRCQSLWIGATRADATQLATLSNEERCEEIAWASDGYRVGFVINGYQLRIFDGYTGEPKGQVNLLEQEGSPSARIARGITFSANGAAVTFDDCPRHSSGCRSGLVAIR